MIIAEFNRSIKSDVDFLQGTADNVEFIDGALMLRKEETTGPSEIQEDFEEDDLSLAFSGDWFRTAAQAHSGTYCYRSKAIGHSQSSSVQITVTLVADGSVSFWYRVSSEAGYDKLWFYIDGVEKLGGKSGSIGWTQASFLLAAGQHELMWKYTKDGSVSSGEDSAYIDDVAISGVSGTVYSYVPNGCWTCSVDITGLDRITGSRIFWNADVPEGIGLSVWASLDSENWAECADGSGIPGLEGGSQRRLYIKVVMSTSDPRISPALWDINVSAWHEIAADRTKRQEMPKLYDLHGQMAAVLDNAYGIEIEETLGSTDSLKFSLPYDDPKAVLLRQDQEIVYGERRYIITQVVDSRDEQGKETKDISCESACIELLYRTKYAEFTIDRKSAQEGLVQILYGTAWTAGAVEDAGGVYSMKEQGKTVLWLVLQWAKITGLEVQWDTLGRKVNLLAGMGSNRGAGFWYKKNLKSIRRTVRPPEATVIYPYGRNGLTIKDVNDGVEYLEDYSWYTSQGIALSEAKQRFRKEYVWSDDRFLLAQNLKEAAQRKLAELSQPVISYECSVMDLSSVTGLAQDRFYLGDTVRIHDGELGIDVQTRILRIKRYPQQPWKDQVELSYVVPGLQDAGEPSVTSDMASAQPSVLFASNAQPLSIATTQQYPLSLSITNFSSTNAQVGLMITGQASAALVLTVKFFLGGLQIGPTIQQQCQAGWNTVGVPLLLVQLPSGSAMFDVQVSTSTGTFSVAANHMQLYVYAANLLGGVSPEVPRARWQEDVKLKLVQPIISAAAATSVPMPANLGQIVPLKAIEPEIGVSVTLS